MTIRDTLLFMTSYPARTPRWAIEASLALAERYDTNLSGALCQTHLPRVSNWLADKLVGANDVIARENARSREAARDLLEEFAAIVGDGRRGEQILIDCVSMANPAELAVRARSHDLTIVPVGPELEHQDAAEGLIFDSGRPVLLLPESAGAGHQFDNVVIAWDGSRSAARALAGGIPFWKSAKSVRVVTVTGEKELGAVADSGDIQRHLALHDVTSSIEEVPAAGRDAGAALIDHSSGTGADLLIMGAYGHSRAREFVLGGATRSVLADARLPVLLVH